MWGKILAKGTCHLFDCVLFHYIVVGYNLWSDHVLGWWKQRDNPNVLFLKYEDMKRVRTCLTKLLDLL